MVRFDHFPPEIICAVFESLDLGSLASTAIVATSFQDSSERIMYRTVTFNFRTGSHQMGFLRTVSSSKRRAAHVGLLALHDISLDEEKALVLQNLERAMELMVNLKKLTIRGNTFIRHAHLESATFSLTHLSLGILPMLKGAASEYDTLLPILGAHPELRGISLPHSGFWPRTPRFDALEEQHSNLVARPSAVLCPLLEYIESYDGRLGESFLVGRRVKHLVINTQGMGDGERDWGSPSMLPRFAHLETLFIFESTATALCRFLSTTLADHLVHLTRLSVLTSPRARLSLSQNRPQDPVVLAITRIQKLESLTLSAQGPWCAGQSEQDDMVQFLYKRCPKLKETFVQRSSQAVDSTHSHYGVNGKFLGIVNCNVAFKGDLMHAKMFALN